MSFPRFFTLLLACMCGGTTGFVHSAPKFAVKPKPSAVSRFPPLVQVASVAVEPLPGSSSSSLIRTSVKTVARKYVTLSEEKPIVTKGVSAALVGAVGDVFSQSLFAYATGVPFRWDMMRTVTFMMMGLLFKGPALHMWYNVLGRISKWTKIRMNFSPTSQSLTALTVDQTVGVAIFYPLYFIVFEIFSAVLTGRCKYLITKDSVTMFIDCFSNYSYFVLALILFLSMNSAESIRSPDQNGGNVAPGHFCPILRVALGAILVLQILPSVAPRSLFRWHFRLLELLSLRSLGGVKRKTRTQVLAPQLVELFKKNIPFHSTTTTERPALFSPSCTPSISS